jgi:hypothetical protein
MKGETKGKKKKRKKGRRRKERRKGEKENSKKRGEEKKEKKIEKKCIYRTVLTTEVVTYIKVVEEDLALMNTTAHLGPDTRTCDLYDLSPATPYYVQVNGSGDNVCSLVEFPSLHFWVGKPVGTSSGLHTMIHGG